MSSVWDSFPLGSFATFGEAQHTGGINRMAHLVNQVGELECKMHADGSADGSRSRSAHNPAPPGGAGGHTFDLIDNQTCLSTKGKKILGTILLVIGVVALLFAIAGAIAAGILLTGGALPAIFAFVGLKLALGVGIAGLVAGLAGTISGGILCTRARQEDQARALFAVL